MRIAIGGVAHETNTFSNVPTTKELFELWEWSVGEDILLHHRGVRDFIGGMIDRAEEYGFEVIPTFLAAAYPAGTITEETYQELKSNLIEGIRRAGEVDAILLSLHGAGVAEGVDDVEGDLLQSLRTEFGELVPIVATLDLHGNLTEKMVAHASALLGVHLYPHTDCYERGLEAVEIARRIVRDNLKPTMHLTRLPLMIPTSTTNISPAKDVNERCWNWEKEDGVIDCAFFHGFPYTDIPDVCVSVLSITEDNPQLARRVSEDVAQYIWSKKEEFAPDVLSCAEGIEAALKLEGQPIVINETSDNPGGGTPGDGTHLLRAMLEADLMNSCFGFIYDPEVARIAHQAGAGATIEVELGGKTDHLHGEPLRVKAYVKTLSDGTFIASTPMGAGGQVHLGKSARLQIGSIDVLVCSIKSQVLDEQIFLLHGIDVRKYKIVALKSSQHFRAAFEPISQHIVTVDSPGLTTLLFTSFDYKRINRPMYPIDEDTTFVLTPENEEKPYQNM
ncbi:M81 family metallopeptidase [Brevibacillus ruminantium]|uniref:M81 family metallopeptidase n=1 Tax=Brevibacillus ruminantium TaxID=2950604 RepID=A0ABY4WA66_9BACL|nr:M81 family metallopeptidase [Brevibacillus ruminantium]USG64065.1 M81 family metallopeptidase [Brevibacillus ruminantium]